MDDGLLLLDRRIVIPSAQREDILALLHEGHEGVRHSQKRARECVCGQIAMCILCLIMPSVPRLESCIPSH